MKHTRRVVRDYWGKEVLTAPAAVKGTTATQVEYATARAEGASSAGAESSLSSGEDSTATAGVLPAATTLVGGKFGEEDAATEIKKAAAEGEVAEQPPHHPAAMVCLVDPPRAGLLPGAVDVLLDMDFDAVVYIACGDGTLRSSRSPY